MLNKIKEKIHQIKNQRPLILNITNYVSMDFIANGLLSIGASPVMSMAEEEIENLVRVASAVVINIGTVNTEFTQLCRRACRWANELNKPIIFDPVGAGASEYRTNISLSLIQDYQLAIIRGNASEIISLSGESRLAKGVDSVANSLQAIESAKTLSKHSKATVVVSGKIDLIVEGERVEPLEGGSDLMPSITGTGCLLSATVAAFHAVEKNRFEAAKMAAVFYGRCGEIAEKTAKGPATFRMQFLDTLYLFGESL